MHPIALALAAAALLMAVPVPASAQTGAQRVENRLHSWLRAGARAGWEDPPGPFEGEYTCALLGRSAPLRIVVSVDWSAPCPASAATCPRQVRGRQVAAFLRDPVATGGGTGWGRIDQVFATTDAATVFGQPSAQGLVQLVLPGRLHAELAPMGRRLSVAPGAPAPIGGFRVEEGLVGQIEVAGARSPMVCRRSDRDQLRRMVP